MSQCKKFAPNIFHKTKCSNCFRQKEEHSAEALECNRASRSIARSGYLFVAPDWDFSVPLNRTKRWQRRWFVLYDDGELNYSVDEHPDTVPQGSVDMSKVMEVTAAEQITGHPHSVALTSPDRVTFIKAASREDARWWVELLAMFPRRHKRNATFPGGRASPSLPQLGRSASPQPPRPRLLSCTTSGPSPRTNFETPPLKEERESPPRDEQSQIRPSWLPGPTSVMPIETIPPLVRNEYIVSSGSPPTRDKLRCDDKARARRDWRHERLRDIATALTDRSPESSLALPAEGLLHLKKGWLWQKISEGEWARRWVVLCLPTLTIYRDQDEQAHPDVSIELSSVTSYGEVPTESKYGFEIRWSTSTIVLSAVTTGIRTNWLDALKKSAPTTPSDVSSPATSPATPRSLLLSSDEEYKTASENDRRGSGDWTELPSSPPLTKLSLSKMKERVRIRPRLPRCQSRQNTVDSTSTDELDSVKEPDNLELYNALSKQNVEINDLQNQLSKALCEKHSLEEEIARLKKIQSDAMIRERKIKEIITNYEQNEQELNQRNAQAEIRFAKDQKTLQIRLSEAEETSKNFEEKFDLLTRELHTKQRIILNLQNDLLTANERYSRTLHENDRLSARLQELEERSSRKNPIKADSLHDLTDIDLDLNLDELSVRQMKEYCSELKYRFEKAISEIRAVKKKLRESYDGFDRLELVNVGLEEGMKMLKEESQAEINLLAIRLEKLTSKLVATEKQIRNKSKTEQRDKRRSLSLKGRESFSINKEVEDKVTELEAKIVALERGRTRRKFNKSDRSNERSSPIDDKALRRLRRKSLDSATASEPLKLLMRLSSLESKVTNVNVSTESLNILSNNNCDEEDSSNLDSTLLSAKKKLRECLYQLSVLKSKNKRSSTPISEKLNVLETNLNELNEILNIKKCGVSNAEIDVINSSVNVVIKQLETLLIEKLSNISEKKRMLKENNKLDSTAKLNLLAEKVAYENILISRIQDALNTSLMSEGTCDRILKKEVSETAHLINALQYKFDGNVEKQPPVIKTSAEYLSKILSKALLASTRGSKGALRPKTPCLKFLEDERVKLHNRLVAYKSVKLPQLAESLAVETMNLISDKTCRLRSLTEETKAKFTQAASERVNVELMQAEINHVLLRAAHMYQNTLNADHNFFFSFFASERAALELWADSVSDYLFEEINRSVGELSELYQNCLNKLQRQNWRRKVESERNSHSSGNMLSEFADIVAHKALVDARIDALTGKLSNPFQLDQVQEIDLANTLTSEDCWNCLQNESVQIDQSLQAEFLCLVNRYAKDCYALVQEPEVERILECLSEIADEVDSLQKHVHVPVDVNVVFNSWNDVCSQCALLRDNLTRIRCALETKSSVKKSDSLEKPRPMSMGTEYLAHLENLRAAYQCTLASCKERHQQVNIEELQHLCESVLLAMEQWYRRTIQELREKHADEMELLRQEKEQALKEETQATLAALDAMRKAHEAEVQREVAKFKQDFARRQRDEVLDLSEELSVKRLEASALSDKLGSATRQLAHAQQHIMALERNPQLASMQN